MSETHWSLHNGVVSKDADKVFLTAKRVRGGKQALLFVMMTPETAKRVGGALARVADEIPPARVVVQDDGHVLPPVKVEWQDGYGRAKFAILRHPNAAPFEVQLNVAPSGSEWLWSSTLRARVGYGASMIAESDGTSDTVEAAMDLAIGSAGSDLILAIGRLKALLSVVSSIDGADGG